MVDLATVRSTANPAPAALSREELLEAGEDIEQLLDACETLDLSPACRTLLLDLDESLTRRLS